MYILIPEIKMKTVLQLSIATLLLCAVVFADDDEDKKESVGTVIGIDLGTTYSW